MQRLGLGVLIALVVTAGVAYSGQKSDADVLRELRDRAEIEDLMWRYTRALDTRDPDAYAAMYTADGQFVAGANATKGHAALKKMVADLRERYLADEAKGVKQPAMFHMTANERVQFLDKDHARIEAYFITAFGAVGQGTPLRVAAVGRSIDELARVNGRWLITSRNVAPQD